MTPTSVNPPEAQEYMAQGALLIDIREPAEFLREHIPGAISLPLAEIVAGKNLAILSTQQPIIFHCQSGMRTAKHANDLAKATGSLPILLLSGGINAWKSTNLPTIEDKQQPLPIMRQVQIITGLLILLGVVLGYILDTRLFLLAGLVGAGLLFAGLSGWCGMAILLAKMPWNRVKH